MQKMTTVLRFDAQAEEAVNFCISIFKGSKIVHVALQQAARHRG